MILKEFIKEMSRFKMVRDLDFEFDGLLWQEGDNFKPSQDSLDKVFDIINEGIFENGIKSDITKKVVVDPESAKVSCASFFGGKVQGLSKELFVFTSDDKEINFFEFVCIMIHEMIHAYDYEAGPISKLLNNNVVLGQFNYGLAFGDPLKSLENADLKVAQLPGDFKFSNRHSRQYLFPKYDMEKSVKVNKLSQVERYTLSEDSMYDVHGGFFKKFAGKANAMGFDVNDIFYTDVEHRMRRVAEADGKKKNQPPSNSIEAVYDILKSEDLVQYNYKNSKNWFIGIS